MKNQRAFALRDCVFGTAVLAALAAVTLPALSKVRMDSMRQACIGNYRFIASTSSSYINDNAGKMWALNWKAGTLNPMVPGTQYFSTDSEAQSYQAIGIYRRLANLTAQQTPVPAGWVPQILSAHTALLDYVNQPIPASFMVCPSDSTRQEFLDGDYSNLPASGGDGSSSVWRWIYSSSYQWDVYQWSPSRTYQAQAPWGGPLRWAAMPYHLSTTTNLWSFDGDTTLPGAFGPKLAADVRFPSQKVFLSDDYARHNGQTRYFAEQSAAQDLLFHDGSVRYFRTDSTNPGWNPQTRSSRGNMTNRFQFTKEADAFGALSNGARSVACKAGWYRWTRGGLFGWDVPRLSSMVGKLPSPGVVENEVNTGPATGTW
ncbi:MAG: hypothetical protein J0L78_14815 [Planctomycetes bacterium]|nr:hypothetical protein [Planctomycetota bacterium]